MRLLDSQRRFDNMLGKAQTCPDLTGKQRSAYWFLEDSVTQVLGGTARPLHLVAPPSNWCEAHQDEVKSPLWKVMLVMRCSLVNFNKLIQTRWVRLQADNARVSFRSDSSCSALPGLLRLSNNSLCWLLGFQILAEVDKTENVVCVGVICCYFPTGKGFLLMRLFWFTKISIKTYTVWLRSTLFVRCQR